MSFILHCAEATQVCSSNGERQEPKRASPIEQGHFKPLFRAYLHLTLAKSHQMSKPNTVVGWEMHSSDGGYLEACEYLLNNSAPIFRSSVLCLLITRLLGGVAHMGCPQCLPSASLPFFLHLTPVASATTTPPWCLFLRSPSLILAKPMDVFPSSSLFISQ